MRTTGNTILITGGATGIGFALAQKLVAGENTVIVCSRSEDSLARAAEKLPELVTRRCDVSVGTDRQDFAKWLAEAYPKLNVLINNAAVQHPHDFNTDEIKPAEVAIEIDVNLISPIMLISELLPILKKQDNAAVINITSGLAYCPLAKIPVYCAAKAGLHSFTMSLRFQLARTSVRVIEMAPPVVATGLGGGNRAERTQGLEIVSPDDFAMEAIRQWEEGREEIFVGFSEVTRERGEAMFSTLNH